MTRSEWRPVAHHNIRVNVVNAFWWLGWQGEHPSAREGILREENDRRGPSSVWRDHHAETRPPRPSATRSYYHLCVRRPRDRPTGGPLATLGSRLRANNTESGCELNLLWNQHCARPAARGIFPRTNAQTALRDSRLLERGGPLSRKTDAIKLANRTEAATSQTHRAHTC